MGTTGEMLVVDDEARMREFVAKVLVREGYAVRSLPRGQDVLQALDWQMDTILLLEALGVCRGLESIQPPQEERVDTGAGHAWPVTPQPPFPKPVAMVPCAKPPIAS
jgi:CheY-like chemotaxis protein